MARKPGKAYDPEADFAAAVEHYQNGRHTEARHLAERVVLHNPSHAAAWHLLGVLHSMTGNQANARVALEKAVRGNPNDIGAVFNYATLLSQLGEHGEAANHFRRALAGQPDNLQARLGFAHSLARLGRKNLAIQEFRRVLATDAGNLPAALELSDLLLASALPEQAVEVLDAARTAHPENAALTLRLILMLKRIGKLERAELVALAQRRRRPDDADLLAVLGGIVRDRGRAQEAIAFCGEAIRLKPNTVDGHLNLAAALFDVGEFDGAIVCYRKVLELDPKSAEAQAWLGSVLQVTGRIGSAIRALRKAIAMQPDMALAHFNLALALLSVGRYPEGWAEYEWRWRTDGFQRERRDFRVPAWDGGDLAGRRLLIWTEQGFGDTFQFARYLPLLAGRGAQILVEIQPQLERMMKPLAGVDRWIARGKRLPAFDCHLPLMSLPHRLGTTLAAVPAEVPYLSAEPARVAAWKSRLDELPGFRIGLCWQGSQRQQSNHLRSLPVAALAPLAELPGVGAVSLQMDGADEIAAAKLSDRIRDFGDELDRDGAFVDSAAIIENLDLVVTVDTAIAHLAGALGRPAWLLLGSAPDYRWLLTREDSPWYPTLRIFRQQKQREWGPVVERVRQALARRIAGGW